jgi:NitT/TauT family transport system substrate-binding protein
MQIVQSRRDFLASASLVAVTSVLGARGALAVEPAPETTTIRLAKPAGGICAAPHDIAGELLRAEGFTDVRYVEGPAGVDSSVRLAGGELDFDYNFTPAHILSIEDGVPIKVLAGMHSGCVELIAHESVQRVTDLKGKRVGMDSLTAYPHLVMTLKAAYVGIDPVKDIEWVPSSDATAMQLFVERKIDAFFAIPPVPQEARARKIGHTILSTTFDRPWSEYFCCMLAGTATYVTRYPMATKRALRAMLKAADFCVSNPERAAQQMVDLGASDRYEYALATLTDVRFDTWREFDAEDTLRFYVLRMHEGGLIKSTPNKIIAEGTDWRFLNELKRELKG